MGWGGIRNHRKTCRTQRVHGGPPNGLKYSGRYVLEWKLKAIPKNIGVSGTTLLKTTRNGQASVNAPEKRIHRMAHDSPDDNTQNSFYIYWLLVGHLDFLLWAPY